MSEAVETCTHPEEGLTLYEDGFVKINEDFFWKAVNIINWAWLSENMDSVDKGMFKYKLLKKYDVAVWKAVKAYEKHKYSSLREMLRTYDVRWRTQTGDDSTWDLCSHVIGLGREAYLDAMVNPEHLIERGRTRNFKENFGYWIPSDEKCDIPNSVDFIDKEG